MTEAEPIGFTCGPIQRALLARVEARFGRGAGVSFAARSPLGQRAIRIQPGEIPPADLAQACREIADWLRRQDWIAAAIATPTCVYARPQLTALSAWVQASCEDPLRSRATGADLAVSVRTVPSHPAEAHSLQDWRVIVIGRSIRQLIGFVANRDDRASLVAEGRVLTVRHDQCDHDNVIAVGPVDVENGTMKARHGGVVTPLDLRISVNAIADRAAGGAGALIRCHWETVVAFILGRVDRLNHARIGQDRIENDVAACAAIFAAIPAVPGAGFAVVEAAAAQKASELALELDLFGHALHQAAIRFEPAPLLRYAYGLARRVQEAGAQPGGGLAQAASRSLITALRCAGCIDDQAPSTFAEAS